MGDEKENLLTPKIELSANLELKAEVSEPISKVTDRLLELLSPFTESMGLLGDAIRLKRQEVLLKIVLRARAIAEAETKEIEPAPLKFLTHFVERASLEDEESPLIDMWARLLLSAAGEHERNLNWCVRVLDEIDPSEASLLQELGDITSSSHADAYTKEQAEQQFNYDCFRLEKLSDNDLAVFFAEADSVFFALHEDDIPSFELLDFNNFDDGERFLHLEALGLVWVFARKLKLRERKRMFVLNARLTPLGSYFVKTVTSDD